MIRQALVLCAGLGTRLRPLTQARAKPAIPVAGEAMIRRIAAWLAGAGVDDLVVNLHHRPETLTACLGDGTDLGARVRYSWELPRILGSAGGPRLARPIVGADTFFIINGDTLTDVALGDVAAAHQASGALVTLALVPNREFLRYGGVRVAGDGAVTGFVRRGPAAEGTYHYIGVQLAAARVFDGIAAGEPASSIGGVYDVLIAAQPGSVRAAISDAAFFDVGTPADYWRTSQAFAPSTKLGTGPSTKLGTGPSTELGTSRNGSAGWPTGARVTIDASARVTRSILWDDVTVDAGAQLDECIITDGVHVAAGASHRREILVCGEDGQTRVSPLNLEP